MKIFPLSIVLIFSFFLNVHAQTVVPQLINVKELAQYEKANPRLFIPCTNCPKKEIDGGWKSLKADLPIPPGATIKYQQKNHTALRPLLPHTPLSPSPPPTQNFLGHVDPGQTIPPDTHGAVGLNHVVTATNDYLVIHNKYGGAVISSISINTFTGLNSCDPYLTYDPSANRWIYTALECSGTAGNKLFLAVSQTSDPTGNWFRYSFVPDLPGGTFNLDHPYVGFDNRWLVISGRKFPAGNFSGSVLFIIDKATVFANGNLHFGTNAQAIEKNLSDQDVPLPVSVYGANPNPNTFYVLQSWNANSIRLSTITGDIPTASWNTTNAVYASGGTDWNAGNPGNIAEQFEETRRLATNDSRISSGVMVNGNVWCAHHIAFTNNVAVQWWQLNGTAGPGFGNILQRGRIGDGEPNTYRYFPSIAVNNSEDVIIGYTVSSNTSRVSSAYSFRNSTTPPNTTLEENIYKTGLSTYWKDFSSAQARWGDYSHSAPDPSDGSLWTIQEYADQRTGSTDNGSKYGVWWAQVHSVSALYQQDASIGIIIDPQPGLTCMNSITPGLTIRNLGTDTLKSVQIGMLLDGVQSGNIVTINNLLLPSFASSGTITLLTTVSPAPGIHSLAVYTLNPNGLADQRAGNDTLVVTFTVAPVLQLPYTESFENPVFPPANGSDVINPDAGSITWTRSEFAGSPGNACMSANLFGANNVGERDIYRTPKINVGTLDSLVVNFNVAYKEYAGAADSLKLLFSTDCGISWLPAGYAKGGTSLSTSPGTGSISFIPVSTEWRSERVVLKDFCTNRPQTIMLGFESYNDFGNNIYVDGISITGFNSAQRNAVLHSITEPPPALCTNNFTPVIIFGNAGEDTIRTLKINYQVDGGPVTTINWLGMLAKCNTVTINLPAAATTTGTHHLKVFLAEPNGLNDFITSNDSLQNTFTVFSSSPSPTPVVEGFESTVFPGNNWGVQNPDGLVTWERSDVAAKTGAASLWINNPSAGNGSNTVDRFIGPIVANNLLIDSIFVAWDHAYRPGPQYPGSGGFPMDTLEIAVTKDCGNTFIPVWKKWGNDLHSVNDPNYVYSGPFIPTQDMEWRSNRVYLSPFVGSSGFQVCFIAKSNKQNNLWIDNINISSKTLPARLKKQGYLLYPNPFTHSFLVHHWLAPVELKAIQVYNATGQLVWDKRFHGNAGTEINIDLKNMANGVYVLKMVYSNKTIIERLVKN